MRAAAGVVRVLLISLLLTSTLIVGGCGNGDGGDEGNTPERLSEPEGALDLIALPGYAEDGSRDPAVDWVTPFEKSTGCHVRATVAESPDQVIRLARSGDYDGVAARGDVSGSLIEDGLVDPVNLDLIPNYADYFPNLEDQAHDTVDGVHYGIPQGRSANLLMWRPAEVKQDPQEEVSSDLIFDPERASRYAGRITLQDNPMSIADAAVYLREHEPDLGIGNVYELDQDQFEAAVELLREQRRFIGSYWTGPLENARAFASSASVAGTGSLLTANTLRSEGVRVDASKPKEGATGLSDSWMLSSTARHPNCMYLWMNHVAGPSTNAAIAVRTGQAPANERACNLIGAHCDLYRAADEELFDDVELWATPLRDCGDDRGDVCKSYDEWARAFAEVKG